MPKNTDPISLPGLFGIAAVVLGVPIAALAGLLIAITIL